MEIGVEKLERVTVVMPEGPRLDAAAAPSFKSSMVDLINTGASLILVDLSKVDFMDSTGLASLMSSMKSLGKEGEIALCGLSGKIRKLFAITKLDRGVFRIFDDRTAALAAF